MPVGALSSYPGAQPSRPLIKPICLPNWGICSSIIKNHCFIEPGRSGLLILLLQVGQSGGRKLPGLGLPISLLFLVSQASGGVRDRWGCLG